MTFKLPPAPKPVQVSTSIGALTVRPLGGSDLEALRQPDTGARMSTAELGGNLIRQLVTTGDGTALSHADVNQLTASDLEALVTAITDFGSLKAAVDGEPLERLGASMQLKLDERSSEFAKFAAAAAGANSLFVRAALEESTVSKLLKHSSALEEATRALRNSTGSIVAKHALASLTAKAPGSELQEAIKNLANAATPAADLARRLEQLTLPPAEFVPPIQRDVRLATNPMVESLRESTKLARRNTEASIDAATHLRVVADQTATMAAEVGSLAKVFLEEVIPQWHRNADHDRKAANISFGVAAAALVVGVILTGYQIYLSRADREADSPQQVQMLQVLNEQLAATKKTQEQSAREAAELRSTVQALTEKIGSLTATARTSTPKN